MIKLGRIMIQIGIEDSRLLNVHIIHAPGPDSRKLDLINEEAKVGQGMCEPATIPGSSEEMGFLQLCQS